MKSLARAGRGVLWGLVDQSISSATNLLLGLVVARELDPKRFGVFALCFATYIVAMGVSRALSSEALATRFSGVELAEWRAATRQSCGSAVAIGCMCTLISLPLALMLGGEAGLTVMVFGVSLPGLLLQDSWRFAFFAGGKGRAAVTNDLVWAVILGVLLFFFAVSVQSMAVFVLVWGFSASVAAAVGSLQARAVPRPWEATRWWRRHGDLSFRYLGDFVAGAGSRQIVIFAVAAQGGLIAAAGMRAAEILLGPLNVLVFGLNASGVPEASRLLRTGVRQLLNGAALVSTGIAAAALVWGFSLSAIPDDIGRGLIGPVWDDGKPLLVPLSIFIACAWAGSLGPALGLRAMAAASRLLRTRLKSGGLILIGGVGGAALGGAVGAAWGLAVVSLLIAGLWWRVLVARCRAYRPPWGTAPEAAK